jgi:hypothetical protein
MIAKITIFQVTTSMILNMAMSFGLNLSLEAAVVFNNTYLII